jgi:uncharacterized protein (DUF2237 family)
LERRQTDPVSDGEQQEQGQMAKNVWGDELACCSSDPVTGVFRNGKCDTCAQDRGMHTVCVEVTDAFLAFARNAGNDLISPAPEYNFPGLKPGDRWCVCLGTWIAAVEAGVAPGISMRATHLSVTEHVDMDVLREYDLD